MINTIIEYVTITSNIINQICTPMILLDAVSFSSFSTKNTSPAK